MAKYLVLCEAGFFYVCNDKFDKQQTQKNNSVCQHFLFALKYAPELFVSSINPSFFHLMSGFHVIKVIHLLGKNYVLLDKQCMEHQRCSS